ncbi:MAG TPA: FAD-dependent oxidoreductase, partial [Gammaproteobacteria bacterium]|nr:FAD-dependent oxidoreductase [Gammaproteobacteria bacterium]
MTKPTHPHYQYASGWNAMLPERIATPSLSADMAVDTAIIGAGYTGISAAKRMHELAPSDEIAIIDSSEIGEGNPGRNS